MSAWLESVATGCPTSFQAIRSGVWHTRTGRSRFPVVQRESRRVLGFVHVKDILGYAAGQRRLPIPADLIRPLATVPPDRTLADLLLTMRRESLHIVLVSDGRHPLGVITLDDVIHAVVGEPAPQHAPVGAHEIVFMRR